MSDTMLCFSFVVVRCNHLTQYMSKAFWCLLYHVSVWCPPSSVLVRCWPSCALLVVVPQKLSRISTWSLNRLEKSCSFMQGIEVSAIGWGLRGCELLLRRWVAVKIFGFTPIRWAICLFRVSNGKRFAYLRCFEFYRTIYYNVRYLP